MVFHFRGRYALLTYAQCGGLDPWAVSNYLSSIGAECIIGRESHENEGIHLHAFVDFNRQFSTRSARKFDVEGCHPNVQPCGRTPEKMWDYATKDGDVVAGGLERPGGSTIFGVGDVWTQIILAPTRDRFFELCAELAPRTLIGSFNSVRAYADWKYRPVAEAYRTPDGVRIDAGSVPELGRWVSENLEGHILGGKISYTYPGSPPGRVSLPSGGPTLAPYGEPLVRCAGSYL